jgi:hypothetical protein
MKSALCTSTNNHNILVKVSDKHFITERGYNDVKLYNSNLEPIHNYPFNSCYPTVKQSKTDLFYMDCRSEGIHFYKKSDPINAISAIPTKRRYLNNFDYNDKYAVGGCYGSENFYIWHINSGKCRSRLKLSIEELYGMNDKYVFFSERKDYKTLKRLNLETLEIQASGIKTVNLSNIRHNALIFGTHFLKNEWLDMGGSKITSIDSETGEEEVLLTLDKGEYFNYIRQSSDNTLFISINKGNLIYNKIDKTISKINLTYDHQPYSNIFLDESKNKLVYITSYRETLSKHIMKIGYNIEQQWQI